jgi:energy-coupling factor transporter transmembrane protein EcfT
MKKYHWFALGLLLLLSLFAEFVLLAEYPKKHWWSSLPFFYGILGFIGCMAVVAFSKLLGALFLYKDESYYDAK